MGTRHRQGSRFSAVCSVHAASPRRGSSFSVRSTCCPVARHSHVLFHSASAFLPRAPERRFIANGRVRRRCLFIYSARWPGVKERKCLFFPALYFPPPSLSPSRWGLGTKCSSPWLRFSLKINPERKKAPPSPSLHLLSPLIRRHSSRLK